MKSIWLLLSLVGCVMASELTVTYNISYTLTCTAVNAGRCITWSIGGTMYQDSSGCFPENTTVLTDVGYKPMKELQVGDHIYAYNPKTKRSEFTQVYAWLHRDTESLYEYVQIGNKEIDVEVYASQYHNIATLNQFNEVEYKFGGEVLNTTLVGSERGEAYSVTSLGRKVLKGIYAPYTALGNFYIMNSEHPYHHFLAHSFAHIKNPEYYELLFGWSVTVCGWFGLNQQPFYSPYRHPLAHFYQSMFPQLIEKDGHYVGYEEIYTNQPDPEASGYTEVSTASAGANSQRNRQRRIKIVSTLISLALQVAPLNS